MGRRPDWLADEAAVDGMVGGRGLRDGQEKEIC